jgi:nucleosome assembly protein 1-like 1
MSEIMKDPEMMRMLQEKFNSLEGQTSGYVESLPLNVQKRLNALRNLRDQHNILQQDFRAQVLELEKSFLKKYQPLYNKRADIIAGNVEPTESECARPEDDDEDLTKEMTATEEEAEIKGVPEFWSTILKNHPQISEMVTEHDEPLLAHLTDIKIGYVEGNSGFSLEFFFSENEFFTNSSLIKTYYLDNTAGSFGDVVYNHATGTAIEWKEGKDLTVQIEIKKQRHKGTNKTRTVKRSVPAESFFNFFQPPTQPAEGDEMEEQAMDELEGKLELDYEIGEIIKEKLVPHAVDWFTGHALEHEDFGGFDDDESDYGGEGASDDDDDDEDAPALTNGTAGAAENPECKQQ